MKSHSLNASLRTRLAVLATKDSEFRAALVADPMKAIRANFQLPEGTKVRVVEVDLATGCIVIPHRPTDWPANISTTDALKRLVKIMSPEGADIPEISKEVLAVIAKAMADTGYAATLMKDPVSALRASGIDVPNGVAVMVFQEAPGESIVIVPSEPPSVTLSDDELDDTAIMLQDSMMQTRMSNGSWPFRCSNPPTWCPSCVKD